MNDSSPSYSSTRYSISLRTAALVCLVTYLFVYPVAQGADIVASVLAFSVSALMLFAILGNALFALRMRRRLSVKAQVLSFSDDHTQLHARLPLTLEIRTSPISLPPLTALTLMPQFAHGQLKLAPTFLVGASPRERRVNVPMRFPHRGRWTLNQITATQSDGLGLSTVAWSLTPPPREFRVLPPRVNLSALPLISSSYRAGELSLEHSERLGDPFDLKSYHPSDGLKRILWKTYAKSGELIARHPERAVTPEGQTVVFCLARPEDDETAAAALEYLRLLERAEISISFGCEGMPGTGTAKSITHAESLLIDSVWAISAEADVEVLRRSLHNLLNSFRKENPHANLSKLVIFCAKSRINSPRFIEILNQLGDYLSAQSIAPVFFIVNSRKAPRTSAEAESPQLEAVKRWALGHLFEQPDKISSPVGSGELFSKFVVRCGAKSWQLLSVEV